MAHAPHPLATLDQIIKSPSSIDGIPKEVEDDLRTTGCMLIQEAGVMLGLPQDTIATAQVIFQRFYYVSSLYSFGVNDISISSLFLSTKLCETPIRLRDLINTYLFLLARIQYLLNLPPDTRLISNKISNGSSWQASVPGFHDGVFWEWKDVITASEMQILKRLGFNMQVDLPYSHMINYLKILDLVFEDQVAQMCWSILNDMLLTSMYVIHPPHTLACASILLATRLLRIPLPSEWYILFDAEYDDMWTCCCHVMKLYSDWGLDKLQGSDSSGLADSDERQKGKENRWRRAWVLAQSKKAVRRWLEEREKAIA
uniref:Cyclin-dependent protein kinase regulator n=1 Tax=Kwoniella pini CBS 10737 TaxID=1296096 RepID=A0A1B9I3X5_9TREE|nr:cyclin-dependent protein kinase regulator [Kwoniella pini CBS 10737]OCF50220.1 cyclin-dependent protein kinase regulator [Kwoniella pini CBS 10737]